MNHHTKIVCTLGPASSSEAMILKMAVRGMDVARINFSHGHHLQHQKLIDLVRSVNQKHNYNISILQDLEGYRIRIGHLNKNINLESNKIVYMSNSQDISDDQIPFHFEDDLKGIGKGMDVFIDDGKLHLRVLAVDRKRLKLKVIQGGILKEHKGVNIPGIKLRANIMTKKDKSDIEFGIKNKVEKIAQSFVRNKRDVQRIIDIVRPYLSECKIIAKIESEEGVKNIESILDVCDGIIVARGDLGVSLPIYKIPMLQKYIIRQCSRKKKFSITATQMLDSMIEHGWPTRAEVTDVANAIIDGTDYVMLSGETAVGRYPSRSIKMMSQIVAYTEKYENIRPK